jgi:cyclophilin-like protein
MLWQSNTLVLFYETFRTSHTYTKLGAHRRFARTRAAVGDGTVRVTFELEQDGR